MQIVRNFYTELPDCYTRLIIQSSKVGEHLCNVDTEFVPQLKQFTWCYEKSKNQIYCMDMQMGTAGRIFKYATPRIYLWKYIAYLVTNCTKAEWNRGDVNEYRKEHGIIFVPPACHKQIA